MGVIIYFLISLYFEYPKKYELSNHLTEKVILEKVNPREK